MARFTGDSWLDLGEKLLAEEGPEALKIERLTVAAGRTTGSFYHHFASREGFLEAFMKRWTARTLAETASRFEGVGDAATLRARLRDAPSGWDSSFERNIRRLAATESVVMDALKRLDDARVQGLAQIISVLRPDVEDPLSIAFIQYAAVVGGQWLLDLPGDPRVPALKAAGDKLFGLIDD